MAPRSETNRSSSRMLVSSRPRIDAQPQVRPVAQALAALGLALPIGSSWAATIQVNSALDTSGNPAICTLRDAISSANNDSAAGGCTAGSGADLITFSLAGGTVIPLETPLPPITRTLSVDGGAGIVIERSPTAQAISDFRLVHAYGAFGPFPLALSNLTLRDGVSNSSAGGAGLRANSLSSVTLTNVILGGSKPNVATMGAGATIVNIDGDVLLDHVVADNNSTSQFGAGGVYVSSVGGAVTIRESSFRGNEVPVPQGGGGASISNIIGPVSIERSEFVGNRSYESAGLRLQYLSSPATISNSYLTNNQSTLHNAIGVYDSNAVSIVQSWVTNNRREPQSTNTPFGVYTSGTGVVRVIESTLGPGTGGAIQLYLASDVLIENSTLTGHVIGNAMTGVSILSDETANTAVNIRHSTITGNGYGIAFNDPQPQLTIENSILSGNTIRDIQRLDANLVSNFSLLGSTVPFTGTGNIVSDTPGLNPISATYNPGRTAGPTSNARLIPVHRPLQNSLAIDGGDPAFSAPPALDQVGNPRARTGTSGGVRVDIGAVETLIPRVTVSNGSALEGTAAPNNVLFTVSLSDLPEPGFNVAVDYRTLDGTAIGGSDFLARSGTVTFSNGGNVVSQIISVPTIADPTVEPDETFSLHLNNVSNALFAPAANNVTELFASGTILNDDFATLSIGNASTVEGGNAVFTVALSSPSTNTVSVVYATSGGTAGSGTDFMPASGTVTFLPGETSKVVAVQTIDDLIVEPTENFTVTLSNPTNATITQATGTGTIFDNDFGNSITVVSAGPVTTIYEPAGNCAVTLGVQGVVGLGAGTLVLPNPGIPPVGQSMPYGMQQTELFTCVGGSVNVTVTWPGAFESHWKWGATVGSPTPHWYPITTTPMGPNTVRFTITDGGFGDNDLAANGRIVDPYAAAVAAPVPPVPAGGGWWSGLVAAISALLGAIGLRSLRRRRDS